MDDGKLIRQRDAGLSRGEGGPYWIAPDSAPWDPYPPEEEGTHLWDYILRVWRRRWLVAFLFLACLGLSVYKALNKEVRYTAEAEIKLHRDDYDEQMGAPTPHAPGNFIETEIEKIKSRELAKRVVLKLGLVAPGDSAGTASVRDDRNGRVDPYQARLLARAQWLQRCLDVRQIGDTQIVVIRFVASDPIFAAKVVNSVLDEYTSWTYQLRTGRFARYLSEKEKDLERARFAWEDALRALGEFEKSKGFDSQPGGPDRVAEIIEKQRELDRANREAFEASLDVKIVSDTKPTSYTVTSARVRELESQIAGRNTDLTRLLAEGLGAGHPKVVALSAVMDKLKQDLKEEKAKAWRLAMAVHAEAVSKAERHVGAAKARVGFIKKEYERLLSDYRVYSESRTEHLIRRKRVETEEQDYNVTLAALNAVEPPRRSTIEIVDRAEPPLPEEPNVARGIILGAILGLLCGIGIALFIDYMDTKVKGPQEIELALQLPMLALIPRFKNGANRRVGQKQMRLIAHQQPRSHYAESFRYLRTSVQYSQPERSPKTILVTSALEGEGKTTVATNLAIAYAQKGKKVLLVDADVSQPSVHTVFEVERREGLTEILTGKLEETIGCNPCDPFRRTEVKNLVLLPSGSRVPNPIDLLDSDVMRDLLALLAEEYDIVILDSAPLLARADTSVLLPQVDGAILVVRSGVTPKAAVRRAKDRVLRMHGRILGLVINNPKKDLGRYDYEYAYGYRGGYGKARKGREESEDLAEAMSSALHLPPGGPRGQEQGELR